MDPRALLRLSDADTEALTAFLASPERPAGTLTFHELQGFLFTVASSPDPVMPSEWMPLISNDAEMGYADLDEANRVLMRITALYNLTNQRVMQCSEAMPVGCAFREDLLANLEEDAPILQWSRGFTIGHDWLSDTWSEMLPKELEEEYSLLVMTLSFFASRQLAEAYVGELTREKQISKKTMRGVAAAMRGGFASSLGAYAHLGRVVLGEQKEPL